MKIGLPLAAVVIIACGCSCGAADSRVAATATKRPTTFAQEQASETNDKEREPAGRLRAEYHPTRGLQLRLEQLEGRDAYAGAVLIEQKAGAAWKPVEGIRLSLHSSCSQFDECRVLREGGAAAPPASVWPVKIGAKGTTHAECACQACMKLAPGEYRAVAMTCAGEHKLVGESFWVATR